MSLILENGNGAVSSQAKAAVEPLAATDRLSDSILVVDADPVLRQSIAGALQRAGYPVLAQADSVDEALSLNKRLEPALVILGCASPEPKSLDTVRALKGARSVGIVILSPIPDAGWIRQARAVGCDMLLGRPPREGDLLAAVEMSLAHGQARRMLQSQIDALRDRLDTASMVQRAKELLMRNERISDSEAYQRLRRQADRSGRPLKNIAEAVLLAARVAPVA